MTRVTQHPVESARATDTPDSTASAPAVQQRSLQEEVVAPSPATQKMVAPAMEQPPQEQGMSSEACPDGGRSTPVSSATAEADERKSPAISSPEGASASPASSRPPPPLDRSHASKPFPLGPVLPFASLSLGLAHPALPLLETGVGNSSAHLGLVALDPLRSVLRPEVLRQMKVQFLLQGCGRPNLEKSEKEKERERRRSARDRADEEEAERLRKKHQKRQKIVRDTRNGSCCGCVCLQSQFADLFSLSCSLLVPVALGSHAISLGLGEAAVS